MTRTVFDGILTVYIVGDKISAEFFICGDDHRRVIKRLTRVIERKLSLCIKISNIIYSVIFRIAVVVSCKIYAGNRISVIHLDAVHVSLFDTDLEI